MLDITNITSLIRLIGYASHSNITNHGTQIYLGFPESIGIYIHVISLNLLKKTWEKKFPNYRNLPPMITKMN